MQNERAIIIYGPPGAGKGTQAELIARRGGFIHFDTGRYLEDLLHGPEAAKNAVLRRERHLWDTGKLCTPSFVTKVVGDEAIRVAGSRFGIVFSGSPRTMYEAFEGPLVYRKKKHRGLVELLTALYGKDRVSVVQLKVRPGTSLKRNSVRRLCAECGLPMMGHVRHSPPHCPFCGGSMRRRILDDPKVIAVRVKEYEERTFPILKEMRRRGIRVTGVDGEEAPYRVSRAIARKNKLRVPGGV